MLQVRSKKYVGVDVGGTNIKAALVKDGQIIRRIKLPTKARQGHKIVLARITSAIKPFVKQAKGIGIGIAGIVDSVRGIVRFSPNFPGWHNIKLQKILREEFRKPVAILNDVNAICLGEWKYGAAQGCDNVFLFTLGTGVGGAAICEGKPLFGVNGFAGEFGHTVIKYDGPRCSCSNYGHLERYVGSRYIVARARRKIKKRFSSLRNYKKITPQIIAQEAKNGDRVSKEVFSEISYFIAIGITNIIVLFDPAVVIISGGVSRAGRILFEPIRKTVREKLMGAKYRSYRIIPAKLGDDAGVLGAVYYASTNSLSLRRTKS